LLNLSGTIIGEETVITSGCWFRTLEIESQKT